VQTSQDNREDLVKKLEKGSAATRSTPQQHTMTHKNKIQEKSKVGQIKSQYRPIKHKTQESLSKKPRSSNKWRVCYKCREKGHFADSCRNATVGSGTDRDQSDRCIPPVRPVHATGQTHLKQTRQEGPLLQEQGSEASMEKKL
jgi:hypothetical protein